jgi:DmsE family decaheme c-type cytochrome
MKLISLHFRHAVVGALCLAGSLIIAAPALPAGQFKLKAGAEATICLKCHETFQKTLKSRSVHPPIKTGKCSDCHDPHTSTHKMLLASDIKQLCGSCHEKVLPEKARSSHKIVAQGDCLKCHDSHASDNRSMLKKPQDKICFDCHQDIDKKSRELRFKHQPMMTGQGCISCHDPHASVRADYLLKKSVPALCKDCHKTNQPSFNSKHLNYPVADTNCDSCHSAHGSNTRGILYDQVHPPVAENKCTECHLPAASPNAIKTKKQGTQLCAQCHQDMISQTFNKNRVHSPLMDNVGCLNCHNPHGSKQKNLLEAPMVITCGKCHEDTVRLQKWSISNPKNEGLCEPVKTGNCSSCHAPHSADNVLLIDQQNISIDLCGKCHKWESHSTHPIGEKVADPRDKNLTVECLSCHKACGTGNKPAMMPFETTYDLCIQCHPERKR